MGDMIKVHTDTVAMEGTITVMAEVRTVHTEVTVTAVPIIAEGTMATGHIKLKPFSSDAVGNYTRVFLLQIKIISCSQQKHILCSFTLSLPHNPFFEH